MRNICTINILQIILSIILNKNASVGVDIVTRATWNAKRPKQAYTPFATLPPKIVIITQTNTVACELRQNCIELIRSMQNLQMTQSNKNDIMDNFLVGGDGNIYEGRGWDVQPEEYRSYDQKSIFISFVGDYSKIAPTQQQIQAVQELLKNGIEEKKLNKKYKVLGFRQIANNVFPGIHLYEVIKKWKNWKLIP